MRRFTIFKNHFIQFLFIFCTYSFVVLLYYIWTILYFIYIYIYSVFGAGDFFFYPHMWCLSVSVCVCVVHVHVWIVCECVCVSRRSCDTHFRLCVLILPNDSPNVHSYYTHMMCILYSLVYYVCIFIRRWCHQGNVGKHILCHGSR